MGKLLIVIAALTIFYLIFKNSMSTNQKAKRVKKTFNDRSTESGNPVHDEVIPPSEKSMNIPGIDDTEAGTYTGEICPFCGRTVADLSKFCPFCGYSLEEIQESINDRN